MSASYDTLYLTVFSLCALQRLAELFISKRNQEQLRKQGFEKIRERSVFPLMVFMHVAWFPCMLLEFLYFRTAVPALVAMAALGLFAAAQILRVWVLFALKSHWNVEVMGGTSALGFVSTGPYMFVRHPNYLAVIVELASLPVAGGALWTALIFSALNLMVLSKRIPLEEEQLALRPGYLEYMRSKPRLIPKL